MASKVFDSLDKTVADLRGQHKSWENIAREVWMLSDGKVNISGQTLRSWYPDAA